MKLIKFSILLLITISICYSQKEGGESKLKKRRVLSKAEMKKTNNKEAYKEKQSPPTNWENGSLNALSKQNVECGADQAIRGFALHKHSEDTLNYKYRCIFSLALTNSTVTLNTKSAEILKDPTWNTELSQHSITCPENHALQQFNLNTKDNKTFSYSYRCVGAFVDYCQNRTTIEVNPVNILSLADLPIMLKDSQIINWIKLTTHINTSQNSTSSTSSTSQTISYSYNTCDLSDMVEKAEKEAEKAKQEAISKEIEAENKKSEYEQKKNINEEAFKNYNKTKIEAAQALESFQNASVTAKEANKTALLKVKEAEFVAIKTKEIAKLNEGGLYKIGLTMLIFLFSILLV